MHIIEFIYYFISIVSIVLYVMSVQCKKKKNILIVQIGASLCYLIVYSIKGMWSGAVTEVLEEIKDVVFIKTEKKNRKIPFWVLSIFLGLLILSAILFYDGPFTLLPLVINLLLFCSTYYKNPQIIRWVMLVCGTLWGIYNIYGGTYIICVGNILEVVSAAVSLYRFRNKKNIS